MAAAFSSSFDGQQQKPFNLDSSLFLENNPLSMFDHTNTTTNSMDHHLYSSSSSILMTTHHHHHKYNNNNNDDIITPPNKQLMIKKKMRKSKHYPFSPNYSTQSKEKKRKNQKKMRSSDVDEEKKSAPTGYIHVRARRGQATDSHSLAERVRREKISERMKLLQAIVPGCEKVSGKALMLDEIINYVQSLQNQVEFLSMKLASVNPMYYDFETDLEPFMVNGLEDDQMRVRVQQDLSNSVALGISMQMQMQMQSPTTTVNKHPHLLDTYFLYAHPHPQAAGCRETQLWGVDELRHNYNNQLEYGSGSGIQQQPVFFPLI